MKEKYISLKNLNILEKSDTSFVEFPSINKSENDLFKRLDYNTKSIICKDTITNDDIDLETFLENSFSKMLYYINNPDKKKDLM